MIGKFRNEDGEAVLAEQIAQAIDDIRRRFAGNPAHTVEVNGDTVTITSTPPDYVKLWGLEDEAAPVTPGDILRAAVGAGEAGIDMGEGHSHGYTPKIKPGETQHHDRELHKCTAPGVVISADITAAEKAAAVIESKIKNRPKWESVNATGVEISFTATAPADQSDWYFDDGEDHSLWVPASTRVRLSTLGDLIGRIKWANERRREWIARTTTAGWEMEIELAEGETTDERGEIVRS